MSEQEHMSIEEMRRILGREAEGKSDEQLLRMREQLEAVCNDMLDHLDRQWRENPESVRWAAYHAEEGPAHEQ